MANFFDCALSSVKSKNEFDYRGEYSTVVEDTIFICRDENENMRYMIRHSTSSSCEMPALLSNMELERHFNEFVYDFDFDDDDLDAMKEKIFEATCRESSKVTDIENRIIACKRISFFVAIAVCYLIYALICADNGLIVSVILIFAIIFSTTTIISIFETFGRQKDDARRIISMYEYAINLIEAHMKLETVSIMARSPKPLPITRPR